MVFSKLIFIILTILTQGFVVMGYAQGSNRKIDSLEKVLETEKNPNVRVDLMNELSTYYRFVQLDKGLEYATKALHIAEQNKYKKGIASSHYNIATNNFYKTEYKKSLEFYSKSLENYRNLKDKKGISNTMSAIGSVYFSLGEYNKSLNVYNKILKDYTEQKNFDGTAQTYSNIGTLYFFQNDKKKALEFYLKSSGEFKKSNFVNKASYSTTLTNIGQIYFELKNYELAEHYFRESIQYDQETGNLYKVAKNLCSIGDIYFQQKDYHKAEDYHNQSLEIGVKMNNEEVMAYNYGDLGRIYTELAKKENDLIKKTSLIEKGIAFITISTEIFKKNKNLNSYQLYTKYLADAYKATGNYKKALEVFQEHTIYKDSLFNEEKRKAFTRTELSFEFSKREDSIRLQSEKEIAVRDATLTANKRQQWLLFSGIFLLSVIGILLYYQSRIRQKNNQKLSFLNKELNEANQIKARFFSILNHDLRSPVSNIIKFIRLQQNPNFILDETTRQRLEKQTVSSAENLLVSMEDLLLWSKGQMENFRPRLQKTELNDIFKDLKLYFEAHSTIEIEFKNPEQLQLNTDENYLKTIMRNLTSNSIKALENNENPQILWNSSTEGGNIIISISDNGPGGTSEQFRALYDEKFTIGINNGLGMHLVRDMAKAINCKITVETIQQKGTTIFLIFNPKMKHHN